jgi:iron complex transport system substrate-binding protein
MPHRRTLASQVLLAALWMLAVCAVPSSAAHAADYPITIVDSRAREVTIPGAPRRIVSLAPSTTEIVCAVGACDRLVATDSLSDYPPEVKDLPRLGSGTVGAESVLAQVPDLVLGAAFTSPDLIRLLESLGVTVVIVDAMTLDEVFSGIEMVGTIVGSEQGAALAESLRVRTQTLAARVATAHQRPTVYHELDTHQFSVTRETFIGSVIELAGGQNIVASAAMPYPQLSAEYIIVANPDVIVLADAAFGVPPESVGQRPGWSAVSAVRTGRVYPIDPDSISRPGPRIVDGLDAYARLLHPDLFEGVPPL